MMKYVFNLYIQMTKTNQKLKVNEPGFWGTWFAKLMFTLISVKVWGLVACTGVSTWLLLINLHHPPVVSGETVYEYGINGAQWITFNTTIWALIFGMKEIFRISEKRDEAEKEALERQSESEVRLARIKQPETKDQPLTVRKPKDEYDIVPEEPIDYL